MDKKNVEISGKIFREIARARHVILLPREEGTWQWCARWTEMGEHVRWALSWQQRRSYVPIAKPELATVDGRVDAGRSRGGPQGALSCSRVRVKWTP
jgi:hypothetical protein